MTHDHELKCLEIQEKCVQCGLCQRECAFLQKYGMPGTVASTFLAEDELNLQISFECSLCRLCTEVCPVGLDPASMFLAVRRQNVLLRRDLHHGYQVLLNYERRGTSRRFSYYGLPKGSRDVLFPGCAMSGMYPQRVLQLYNTMSRSMPHLGIVLDCCMRPSHDLGRHAAFQEMFREMALYLAGLGVRRVWTACASCHDVLRRYGEGLDARTVYEYLAERPLRRLERRGGAVVVHDPCVYREDQQVQDAVRHLIRETGLGILDMPHERRKTVCCGEGGAVRFVEQELAKHWPAVRKREANGARIVTYCAGCVAQLGSKMPTYHVLDYLFEPAATASGKVRPARSPWTYANRLWLKHQMRRMRDFQHTRERIFRSGRDLVP